MTTTITRKQQKMSFRWDHAWNPTGDVTFRPLPYPHRELPSWAPETSEQQFVPEDVFQAGIRHHHLANTAYPIAHRQTIWQYRQSSDQYGRLLAEAFGVADRMGLYVHIPFCERRCAFCEYTVMDTHTHEIETQYHHALLREFSLYQELLGSNHPPVVGLDIGGGTPSIIDPKYIEDIVDQIVQGFRIDPEFGVSIETTPKIAATFPERLTAYRSCGIERISMGLQMVNPRLLHDYGRNSNTVGHNARAMENMRRAGFQRVNIDLMYGFAKQSLEDFQRTLDDTIQLGSEYITLYRMRYKGTRIAQESREIELARVTDMYMLARAVLTAAGYHANPGKNGFSRIENDAGTSEYLTERVVWGTPYLGLGLGAQTFTNNLLAYNHGAATKRMERYVKSIQAGMLPIQDLYHLPLSEGIAKMLSVSLYFGQIHLEAFQRRFGLELEERFSDEIAFVLERELMEYHGKTLRLTVDGAKVVNGVIALFYSHRVKEYLLSLDN